MPIPVVDFIDIRESHKLKAGPRIQRVDYMANSQITINTVNGKIVALFQL